MWFTTLAYENNKIETSQSKQKNTASEDGRIDVNKGRMYEIKQARRGPDVATPGSSWSIA